jgi:hypothetical protein
MTDVNPCGRCAYGTACTCEYYRDWISTPGCPPTRSIRTGGYRTGYRDGWKSGYAKGFHEARQENKVA